MMISVVLCKINEEINYVSIFHNHVVRIWFRSRPAKLSDYREIVTKIRTYRCYAWNIEFDDMDNLSQTDIILLKCRFIPHNFRRDAWRNL